MKFTLTDYINSALAEAEYDKLEDGSFVGRVPKGERGSSLHSTFFAALFQTSSIPYPISYSKLGSSLQISDISLFILSHTLS